jgi:tyrosyl-tRNA synthetase
MGQQPQDILTLKMLLGTDGRKMSTSWGNTIAIEDPPQEQFGKIMSLRDELIFDYFELATNMSLSEIEARKLAFEQGKCHPRDLKIELAQKIVELYHGAAEAENAKQEFERVFQKKEVPSHIPHLSLSNRRMVPIELLVTARLASSKSEAKRLLLQKGVKINGKPIENWREPLLLQKGMVIQVGKRRFLKIE